MGIDSATQFHEAKLTLTPVSVFIVLTVCVVESTDSQARMSGLACLVREAAQRPETAQDLIDTVDAEMIDFTANRPLEDHQRFLFCENADRESRVDESQKNTPSAMRPDLAHDQREISHPLLEVRCSGGYAKLEMDTRWRVSILGCRV